VVARSLKDPQISDAVAIAQGTAADDVQRILTTLEGHARTRIATWAAARGLELEWLPPPPEPCIPLAPLLTRPTNGVGVRDCLPLSGPAALGGATAYRGNEGVTGSHYNGSSPYLVVFSNRKAQT
jgi:hypothetical protein